MNKTNESIDDIKEKLDYIGLDFDDIPEFLKKYDEIEYRTIHQNDQKKHKIYRFIDVRDIQIYVTPKNRMDSFIDKYKNSKMLINYIDPKDEDDIPLQTRFFDFLRQLDIEQIQEIDDIQKQINKKIPFKVSYDKNYLWEIYYSQVYDRYFMIVPAEDENNSALFYLLKKQIEAYKKDKDIKIYVPVCYMDYTETFLKKDELSDIENYLWLFTGDWPNIYEVFDKNDEITIQIVGNTYIYDNLKSYYKIVLKEKDQAIKYYKYIKALFILQSELKDKYKFIPKIDRYGMLDMYYNGKKIAYEDLPNFIEKEYNNVYNQLKNIINDIYDSKIELEKKKNESKIKEGIFHQKEKEITLYLECKKTVFGRIRYFFKHKKIVKEIKKEQKDIKTEDTQKETITFESKEFYTIEDLININKEFIKHELEYKNLRLDVTALDTKLDMLSKKIKNATQYINEIDEHNKSIFDFWKYTNKDENPALVEGEVQEEKTNKLYKTFDIETDFEDYGIKIDKIQREILSKEECSALYLTQTNVLEVINILKPYVGRDKKISSKDMAILRIKFEEFKEEAESSKDLFRQEEFDILGGLSDDNTKIKYIKGKKHREIEKNKFEILKINKNTTLEEFIDNLKVEIERILIALRKIDVQENMPIYKCVDNIIDSSDFEVFNMNIQEEMENIEDKTYLYKINLKEGNSAVYLSNIMYYDNNNNTLPLGMDLGSNVLVDLKNYELISKGKDTIKINVEQRNV